MLLSTMSNRHPCYMKWTRICISKQFLPLALCGPRARFPRLFHGALSRLMLLRTASTLGRRLAAASTPARHSLARPFAMTATTALGSPTTAASLEALSTQDVEARYRPYLATKNAADEPDWTAQLELDTVKDMVLRMRELQGQPEIKVLVLYGSLRERWVPSLCSRTQEHVADASAANPPPTDRSFSRLTAYEASRVLSHIGADVRVFDPAGLPIKDGVSEKHDKVVELRALSEWSDAQLWVSPEQHGTITAVMKNQSGSPTVSSRASLERGDELTRPGASSRLDPLVGWVGPSYTGPHARHLPGQRWQPIVQHGQRAATTGPVDAHVDGELLFSRKKRRASLADAHLTRPQIPNQSSLPKAWTQYTSSDRLMPSSNRDRLVDVCEELIKATLLLRPYVDLLGDRFSEREEKREHGRLRTQAETEAAKKASEAEKRKVDEQAKRGSEVA